MALLRFLRKHKILWKKHLWTIKSVSNEMTFWFQKQCIFVNKPTKATHKHLLFVRAFDKNRTLNSRFFYYLMISFVNKSNWYSKNFVVIYGLDEATGLVFNGFSDFSGCACVEFDPGAFQRTIDLKYEHYIKSLCLIVSPDMWYGKTIYYIADLLDRTFEYEYIFFIPCMGSLFREKIAVYLKKSNCFYFRTYSAFIDSHFFTQIIARTLINMNHRLI